MPPNTGTIISALTDIGTLQNSDLLLIARPNVADYKITVAEFSSQVIVGSGTVNTVSIVSANGFTGSSSGGANPALTITTSVTGILKGNGTAISSASSGVDYAPGTSSLSTGILKNTTGTGVLSVAVSGDFPTLNQNTSGSSGSCLGNAATVTTNANLTGDVTSVGNASTLATVNSNVGAFTNANITVDAKGRITAAGNGSGGGGTITLTGNVTGSGTSSIATTIATASVTNAMLAGSITASNLVGTDIVTVGTVTTGTWNATPIAIANGGTGQTTITNAINALLPSQTANSGNFLTTNGSLISWAPASGGGGTALSWINVQNYGVLPANSATANLANWNTLIATLAALPNSGKIWFTFYFPSNAVAYSVSGKVDLSSLRFWTILGDGAFSGGNFGSTILGAFSDYIIYSFGANGRYSLEKIRISQASSNAAAWAVGIASSSSVYILNCAIVAGGGGGIDFDPPGNTGGAYDSLILNTPITGNALGIGAKGVTGVIGCGFVGLFEGLRLWGDSGSIIACRFEVCHIPINAGINSAGADNSWTRGCVISNSFEGNDTCIQLLHASNCTFSALSFQGDTAAPSGQSVAGMTLHNVVGCTFDGISTSGTFSNAGIAITNNSDGSTIFTGCSPQRWNIPAGTTGYQFFGCNQATANLVVDVSGQGTGSSVAIISINNTLTTSGSRQQWSGYQATSHAYSSSGNADHIVDWQWQNQTQLGNLPVTSQVGWIYQIDGAGFSSPVIAWNQSGVLSTYGNASTLGMGVPVIYGLDNRTGLVAADSSPITLYTSTAANQLYRVSSEIFATAIVSGTVSYTIAWTQHSITQTMVITSTTINTQASANQTIRPDNGTAITAQLTFSAASGTFEVVGLLEKLA